MTDKSVKRRKNYETKLKIWPQGFNYPIVFCDIVGKEGTQPGKSKSNDVEAKKLVSKYVNTKYSGIVGYF